MASRLAATVWPKSAPGNSPITLPDLREELRNCLDETLPRVLENKLAMERKQLIDVFKDLLHNSYAVTSAPSYTSSAASSVNKAHYTHSRTKPLQTLETSHERSEELRHTTQSEVSLLRAADLPEDDENEHLLPALSRRMSPSSCTANGRTSELSERKSVRDCHGIQFRAQTSRTTVVSATASEARWRHAMFTKSSSFEYILGVAIFMNALVLGIEAMSYVDNKSLEAPAWTKACEVFFCILFAAEISLRLAAQGWQFFNEEGAWNVFDLVTVVLQVGEHLIRAMISFGFTDPLYFCALRVLCPLRIIRLIRVVRCFERLRTIAAAIAGSMKALCFTLAIQSITLYCCSVMFTMMTCDVLNQGTRKEEELRLWFGSLSRTMLTLTESILGGLSWDEAIRPFISECSPLAGIVFCVYIFFSIFAVLNMVTGVYVEQATEMANQDATRRVATAIFNLFETEVDSNGEISWEIFENKLHDERMQQYFEDINVGLSHAQILFTLLDVDKSGSVDTDEMIDGLIRLVGNAKALELKLVHYELCLTRKEAKGHYNCLENLIGNLHMKVDRFVDNNLRIDSQSEVPGLGRNQTRRSLSSSPSKQSLGSGLPLHLYRQRSRMSSNNSSPSYKEFISSWPTFDSWSSRSRKF